MKAYPGLVVAGEEGPSDGVRPAVRRKAGEMDVEPPRGVGREHAFRDPSGPSRDQQETSATLPQGARLRTGQSSPSALDAQVGPPGNVGGVPNGDAELGA